MTPAAHGDVTGDHASVPRESLEVQVPQLVGIGLLRPRQGIVIGEDGAATTEQVHPVFYADGGVEVSQGRFHAWNGDCQRVMTHILGDEKELRGITYVEFLQYVEKMFINKVKKEFFDILENSGSYFWHEARDLKNSKVLLILYWLYCRMNYMSIIFSF